MLIGNYEDESHRRIATAGKYSRINLSQQLNSLMWDRMSKGATIDDVAELYQDICKLAVLSNVEIDRAKREFVINSATEINILKDKYKISYDEKTVKPMFFKMITTENGYELSENIHYRQFNTSMDYLQSILSKFKFREGRVQKRHVVPFMDMVKDPVQGYRQGYYYSRKDEIINIVRASYGERKKIFACYDTMDRDEQRLAWTQAGELKQKCIEDIDKLIKAPATMWLTLKELDNGENKDVSRFIFEVLFGRPDQQFFTLIKESKEDIYSLVERDDGDLRFYDFRFSKEKMVGEEKNCYEIEPIQP